MPINNFLSVHFITDDDNKYSTATYALEKFIQKFVTPLQLQTYLEQGVDEYEIAKDILQADPTSIQVLIHYIDYFIIERLQNKDETFKTNFFALKNLDLTEDECGDVLQQINYLLLKNKFINKDNKLLTNKKAKKQLCADTNEFVTIYTLTNFKCPYCLEAIELLKQHKSNFEIIQVDNKSYLEQYLDPITKPQKIRNFPIILMNNVYIGSLVQLKQYFLNKHSHCVNNFLLS